MSAIDPLPLTPPLLYVTIHTKELTLKQNDRLIMSPANGIQLYIAPVFLLLLVWGGLTSGMLALNRRGPRAGRLALLFALVPLALAHHLLWQSRHDNGLLASYTSVAAGLVIWAWHELAFYSGVLSGPWRRSLPAGEFGWRRFGLALGTHLYHEIAVLAELALLAWVLRDATNSYGFYVFFLSWALQHSAKFSILLGVRWLQIDLFPPHLRYLGSFWRRSSGNGLFPFMLIGWTWVALNLWAAAGQAGIQSGGIGLSLLAALVSFGTLEHLVLAWPRRVGAEVRSQESEVRSTGVL
jgi:putative photosynthetic complex assembly protein 2